MIEPLDERAPDLHHLKRGCLRLLGPSRDAIMPAAIADSADVWQPLLAIARDAARPRETRTTALTWVGRAAGAPTAR